MVEVTSVERFASPMFTVVKRIPLFSSRRPRETRLDVCQGDAILCLHYRRQAFGTPYSVFLPASPKKVGSSLKTWWAFARVTRVTGDGTDTLPGWSPHVRAQAVSVGNAVRQSFGRGNASFCDWLGTASNRTRISGPLPPSSHFTYKLTLLVTVFLYLLWDCYMTKSILLTGTSCTSYSPIRVNPISQPSLVPIWVHLKKFIN